MADGVRLLIVDDEINAGLNQLERAAQNPRVAMEAIGAAMVQRTQRRFETETGPDGQKWQRLSPRTAAQRVGKRRRGSANILRVTARLYKSISALASAKEVTVGTNVLYAAIHQLGGDIDVAARQQTIHLGKVKGRPRFVKASRKQKETRRVEVKAHTVTIPARPYLGINADDRAEIVSIMQDYLRAEGGLMGAEP